MKKLLILLFSVSSMAVASAQSLKTQKGGHCFTVDIPGYMVKTYDLNDVASLQYQNTLKEAYTIVIEDEKDQLRNYGLSFSDAKDFLDDFLADYLEGAENRNVSPITTFTANGNDHAQTELTWSNEGNDFYMLITGVETSTHFYKILCWTLAANKESLKSDYFAISKSLKD